MPIITCERCGFEWEVTNPRKNSNLCSSCRAKKVSTVYTTFGKCVPWHGEYAKDLVTPIDDKGFPVLPGERKCHHSDCVNPRHVIKEGSNEGERS